MNTRQKVQKSFEMIEAAAVKGVRCPMNWDLPIMSSPSELARAGKIKIEISGRNYRQVTILVGPNAGKSTAPDPSGARIWMVIGKTTIRNGEPYSFQVRENNAEMRAAARQRRLNIAARQNTRTTSN